ncbi:MAG: histone deacetylase family protein [Burkholderiaceae bacterium]
MDNLFISHPACTGHSMGELHPESPERLLAIRQALLDSGWFDQMTEVQARPATREQLLRAHSEAHVDLIFNASPDAGLVALDPDTAMNPLTLNAALHASGAVITAVEAVCGGRAKRAFCNVRPPGHHAERAKPMGFCFFNNVAVGAMVALDELGLSRVAIVDFDVHHGNGTEDIFQAESRVLMVSSFQTGLYPGSGDQPLGANMVNVPLSGGSDGSAVRQACEQQWIPALEAFEPELILISAGFDAHREDQLAGLRWDEGDYEWLTRQIVSVAARLGHGRVVSVLEGGYSLPALGRSVSRHIGGLIA